MLYGLDINQISCIKNDLIKIKDFEENVWGFIYDNYPSQDPKTICIYMAAEEREVTLALALFTLNHPLANDNQIDQAQQIIEILLAANKYALTKKTKRELTKKRRCEFQKKRDRLMLLLIERDPYECVHCQSIKQITVDHIIPISKGGSDEMNNLQFAL